MIISAGYLFELKESIVIRALRKFMIGDDRMEDGGFGDRPSRSFETTSE